MLVKREERIQEKKGIRGKNTYIICLTVVYMGILFFFFVLLSFLRFTFFRFAFLFSLPFIYLSVSGGAFNLLIIWACLLVLVFFVYEIDVFFSNSFYSLLHVFIFAVCIDTTGNYVYIHSTRYHQSFCTFLLCTNCYHQEKKDKDIYTHGSSVWGGWGGGLADFTEQVIFEVLR